MDRSTQVFSVVNALRSVAPGGTFRLLLAFTPQVTDWQADRLAD
jgi:hypothetical protein